MSLPASWTDALFAKLSLRYGVAFMRQWPDTEIDAVKADWADVLGGFGGNPAAIRYALENLPVDRPPTALQFRAACRLAPAADALIERLEGPQPKPDPERLAQVLAGLQRAAKEREEMSPAAYAAMRIREAAAARGFTTSVQRHVLDCCERNAPLSGGDMAGFNPIPDHVLPPAMRAGACA